MWAHNNNYAATVYEPFEDICQAGYGYPSCVRGDHGTKNVLVAARMEEVCGLGWGSYIWGWWVLYSVVWYHSRLTGVYIIFTLNDFTAGFGKKWKEFFIFLELHYRLDHESDAHIWLSLHLFLSYINNDIQTWIATWNSHTLANHTETYSTPRKKFGMVFLQLAPISPDDLETLDANDIANYGIDWENIKNQTILQHHTSNNHWNEPHQNLFVTDLLEQLSHISSADPHCPFTAQAVENFDNYISSLPYLSRCAISDMTALSQLWIDALAYCMFLAEPTIG